MALTFDGPKNLRAWLQKHPKGREITEEVAKDWLLSAEGMAWMEKHVGDRQEKATVLVVIDHRNPSMPCVTVYGDRNRVKAKVEHELFLDGPAEVWLDAEAELLSRLKGDYILAYLDHDIARDFVEIKRPWLERERRKATEALRAARYNPELKRLKQEAHAAFDKLWTGGEMTRDAAYRDMAKALGLKEKNCHIGLFDEALCRKVIELYSPREEQALKKGKP